MCSRIPNSILFQADGSVFVNSVLKIFGRQLTDWEGEESRVNYGGIVNSVDFNGIVDRS